jgi:branched-chain amino acid transport system permease protein
VTFFTLSAGAFNGLLLGGLYAITALGLSMVFGVMRLVNVVHGELLVLGAYLSLFISTALGLDPLLTTLIVAVVLFLVGYSLQLWVFNPVMDRGMEPPLLTAFGLSIIAQSLF